MDYSQCPIHNPRVGSDPDVDIFLQNIGVEPEYKLVVFLTICIVVRLALAGLATANYDKPFLPYVAAVAAVFAIFTLVPTLNKSQWWSRKFHLVIALLVLMASGIQIYTDRRDMSIPYLLFADVIFGITTFGYVYFTCPEY
jgi:phosphatidylserine synthase